MSAHVKGGSGGGGGGGVVVGDVVGGGPGYYDFVGDEQQPDLPLYMHRYHHNKPMSPSLRRRSRAATRSQWTGNLYPRLVRRNLVFGQSRNEVRIAPSRLSRVKFWWLLKEDWFHRFLRLPTIISVLMLLIMWTFMILIFAGTYVLVDKSYEDVACGLGTPPESIGFGTAFAFSLETTTTVGYGLPGSTNAFFENCPTVQLVIYLQMVWSMLYNAFFLAFFFSRLARSETRGSQVVFSKKCILTTQGSPFAYPSPHPSPPSSSSSSQSGERQNVGARAFEEDDEDDEETGGPDDALNDVMANGSMRPPPPSQAQLTQPQQWQLQVRVTDADCRCPIVEPHVRMFAKLSHTKELVPLRIHHPNDDLGATLWLSWPTTLIHMVDRYSALHPDRYKPHSQSNSHPYVLANGGFILRQADSLIGSREEIVCPICGDSFGDVDRLKRHIRYNQRMEQGTEPTEGTHLELDLDEVDRQVAALLEPPSQMAIMKTFPHEIIVVVEGIDPLTSGTFQALQSYILEDVVWGGNFMDCVTPTKDGYAIDLPNFREIIFHDDDDEEGGGGRLVRVPQSPQSSDGETGRLAGRVGSVVRGVGFEPIPHEQQQRP